MGLPDLIMACVWPALGGYAVWRTDRLLTRALALREQNGARSTTAPPAPAYDVPRATERIWVGSIELPDDLEAVALLESEPWARDNERQLMRQRYAELATFGLDGTAAWQAVRRGVGVAEMPE